MNNEIKEVLDRLKYIVFNEIIDYGEELSLSECKLLLDYITNLQEENERLKQWDCNKDTRNSRQRVANAKQLKQIQNYKLRIDKSIDKLYCYGEIFDSKILQQFQREMIEILGDKDE